LSDHHLYDRLFYRRFDGIGCWESVPEADATRCLIAIYSYHTNTKKQMVFERVSPGDDWPSDMELLQHMLYAAESQGKHRAQVKMREALGI
jgi:hypothetical protein